MHHHSYKLGVVGLTAIGIGTMVGSGWLFSSYYAARIAGSGSIFAWVLTSLFILILGLCLAEVASTFPKRGLMARLLVISHNKEFAFICTIATWLGLTAVIATEAEGSVQYLASISASFGHGLFVDHQLSTLGLGLSVVLIIGFCLINFWGVKLMAQSNVVLTATKILIPVITALTIIGSLFHPQNFTMPHGSLMPYGASSIFTAMIGAGMVYSFNGFQNIVSFSAEVGNPKRDIPLAMLFAIVITLGVYLLLEIAFIGALPTTTLAGGWMNLNFTSPFVQITTLLNLNLITIVLYVDAVTSPSGTGLIYTGSTSRMLTGMAKDGQMPNYFRKINAYNISRRSLLFTTALALMFLFLFRSWASLVTFLSMFYVISYMSIPICLGALRTQRIVGDFHLPGARFIAPVIFCFLSILFIFSGYPATNYVAIFTTVTYGLYVLVQIKLGTPWVKVISHSCLMYLHIIALALLSSIGPRHYGGYGILSYSSFFIALTLVSIVTYYVAVYRLPLNNPLNSDEISANQ